MNENPCQNYIRKWLNYKEVNSDSRVYELLAILNYLFAPDFYIVFQMSQLTRPFFVLLFDFYAPYTYHGFSSDLP